MSRSFRHDTPEKTRKLYMDLKYWFSAASKYSTTFRKRILADAKKQGFESITPEYLSQKTNHFVIDSNKKPDPEKHIQNRILGFKKAAREGGLPLDSHPLCEKQGLGLSMT